MLRRAFLGALGCAIVLPAIASAQSLPVVAFVNNGSANPFLDRVTAFRAGLSETGFVDGRTVTIEFRWADGNDARLSEIVSDLAKRRVSIFVATGGAATTLAVRASAPSRPTVFVMGADPVKFGIVKSINKPGGNVTGVSFLANTVLGKQIAILDEAIAKGVPIGVLVNKANPSADNDVGELTAAAGALGHSLIVSRISTKDEIDPAVSELKKRNAGALLIFPDALFVNNADHLAALTSKLNMPAMHNTKEFAAAGGLLSYGTDQFEAYRQAGVYAGRILRGEKPSDLPVIQSTRFNFVVNLKTAKSMAITLPPTLVGTADEVIE